MHAGPHIKVALTSNSLVDVDADFNEARMILFYEVTGSGATFLDAQQFDGVAKPEGKRGPGGGTGCANADPLAGATPEAVAAKISSLQGCGVLFTRRLSDFAAVKIQDSQAFPQTFPVKVERKYGVGQVLQQVQQLIGTKPPGWLRKRLLVPEVPAPNVQSPT